MRISVFGLGYVGAVAAGCLARDGHAVIGVDPNATKVSLINEGKTPIIEKDIGEIVASSVSKGSLSATIEYTKAIEDTELSLVCVGTPSQINGSLDLSYVRFVCEQIGAVLKDKDEHHVVVIRSTLLPGSMRGLVIPTLEECSGKKAGDGFSVCNNPEFLREGTAVYDYDNPPKTVVGETHEGGGDALVSLYSHLDAPLIRTSVEVGEMVKYADNSWHALKVCFANEIGNIAKKLGIDGHEVMRIFCKDEKLNLSPYYMKPGFAFGGSCLPKDVRALTYKAKSLDIDTPVLNAILPSNKEQVDMGFNIIAEQGNKKVGILGFSFKAGTDDLRESPIVDVIERLIGKGYEVSLYDRNVNVAGLVGANRDYILNQIPHISKLMKSSMDEVIDSSQTIVIGNDDPEFKKVFEKVSPGHIVVDFVRISDKVSQEGKYDGICW